MKDMGPNRRAYVASDHHLVVAMMNWRVEKQQTTGETGLQMFHTALLRDTDKKI